MALDISAAARALGLAPGEELKAQVHDNLQERRLQQDVVDQTALEMLSPASRALRKMAIQKIGAI